MHNAQRLKRCGTKRHELLDACATLPTVAPMGRNNKKHVLQIRTAPKRSGRKCTQQHVACEGSPTKPSKLETQDV